MRMSKLFNQNSGKLPPRRRSPATSAAAGRLYPPAGGRRI
jgi:hypothetical protein